MTRSKQRSHCKHSCGMCDPGKSEPGTAKPSDRRKMQDDDRSAGTVYMVVKPHHVVRAHASEGGRTVTEYRPDPRYGQHVRNVDAKRAFMVVHDPDLVGMSDDLIRREFDALSRNCGIAKVLRVSVDHSG